MAVHKTAAHHPLEGGECISGILQQALEKWKGFMLVKTYS